jgi:hypothetical protein
MRISIGKLRVGYLKSAFEQKPDEQQPAAKAGLPATPEEQKKREEQKRREASRVSEYGQKIQRCRACEIKGDGVNHARRNAEDFTYDAMITMLTAESAAARRSLRTGGTSCHVAKIFDWPNTFRTARFIPAVGTFRPRVLAVWSWMRSRKFSTVST